MSGLYIHIPFCAKKCFYCSFVISVGQEKRINDYLKCLEAEAQRCNGTKVDSVYLGGGTPSLLSPEQLIGLAGMINSNFDVSDDNEFTIEVNPENVDEQRTKAMKEIGVNRVSLGVQSFQQKYLEYLGRNHDAACALQAFDILRRGGFSNINVDLIYALKDQDLPDLEKELMCLTDLGCEHASLYSLTVEERSRFYTNKVPEMAGEGQAVFYDKVMDILEKAGLRQYEVSNFAKPGFESRHNINYWRGGDYIGLGVGAHSHKEGHRWWNTGRLMDYIKRMNQRGDAREGEENLSLQERFGEILVFGLRMNQGICLNELEERLKTKISEEKKGKIESFKKNGFLEDQEGCLKATRKGRLVLDEIAVYLV